MVCLLSDMNIISCCLVVYFLFPFSLCLSQFLSPFSFVCAFFIFCHLYACLLFIYALLFGIFATIISHPTGVRFIHDANFCAKSKYKNVINSNHNDLNQSDCLLILLDFIFSSHFPAFMVSWLLLFVLGHCCLGEATLLCKVSISTHQPLEINSIWAS